MKIEVVHALSIDADKIRLVRLLQRQIQSFGSGLEVDLNV
jgi:hypothetical protein